ncbi:MAG: PKD domain-containing protein [Aeromicrobium sp.]
MATAGLGLLASPADAAQCPGESPCVVVTYVSTISGTAKPVFRAVALGPTQLKELSDQKPALNSAKYLLRKNPKSKGGKLQTRPIAQGERVGINALLAAADPDKKYTPTFVETPNAAGIPAVLAPGDLVDPDAAPVDTTGDGTPDPVAYPFFENLQPAVYLTESGKLGYVRPLRDQDEDTNAADYFQVTNGRLDITVHTTGKLLAPTVVSSKGTALERSAKTTFSVTYPEEPNYGVRSILWDFGDGSVKGTKRREPSKSYAKKGTYPVAVTVRLNDGSYGRSSALEIKVANPPKAPSSGTGGGDGSGGSGSSGGIIDGGGTLPPPYTPTFPDDVSPPSEIEEPPPAEEPDDLEDVPVDDGLEPVEGYVLAGAEIVPGGTPETIPGTEDSAAPAPATQAALRTRVATWVVAAFAAALLLGLGAATETRWFRHRLRHLRRRA